MDVSGYVFRAYHAITPLTSPTTGEPTHAVYGTVIMLERLLKQCEPALLAVAMDSGKQTFRKELYPEYKAHRPEAPPDLRQQLARVEQVLAALSVPIFVQPGVEADDLIASMVGEARRRSLRVVIVSADKDLMPLVGPDVVLWDTMRDKVWGPEETFERFGVQVNQLRDLLALTGDSSDNIPGVPSVGPKTAQQLLADYGDIAGIYANLAQIKRQKLRETLEQHREQAFLSQRLVTLRDDCPIAFDTEAMARPERDLMALRALYAELGFTRQLAALDERIARNAERAGASSTPDAAIPADIAPASPAPPPTTHLVTTREALEALVSEARQTGRLGVVPALQSLANQTHLVGVAFSTGQGVAHYVPLGHRYVGAPVQLSRAEVGAALAAGLGQVVLAGHDVKAARVGLETGLGAGCLRPKSFGFDTLLASYLIDPEAGNTLAELAERELSLKLPSLETLTKPRRGQSTPLDEVDATELGALLGAEAVALMRLWPRLEGELVQNGVSELLVNLELPLSELLAELEQRGVLVDISLLARLGSEIDKQLLEFEREAQTIVGRPFNVHSPRQLETLLFDELKLKPLKRTKTARSTDAATLEALVDEHPLPKVVLEIRKLSKLKSTYIEALPGLMHPSTGRIHTRWGQAVAATGRLSSSDPNLQNIPIRTDLGREIRSAFVAPPGYELVSADYSQIELRVLAHLSKDPVLTQSFLDAEDVHMRTAMEIFGLSRADVTSEHRRRAKAVNFGVIYGQGEQGLSKSLGIARAEAGQFIAAYFRRYEGVRAFMEATLEQARKTGTVRTLLGRLRRVADIKSNHFGRRAAAERIAMNTPIQGTAADLLKLAMLRLAEPVSPGCRMILTVHDELVFEVPEAELQAALPLIKER
ncbi:MAG TPA: DNA polymerase I, partial [Polyangiaceae bacterium]|nr:DNA polymerase I [Polyangiaceae bacterium]